MTASVISRAGDQLGQFLPRLGGALALLIGGLIVAAILGRLVRSALSRLGVDRLADRLGAAEALARAGIRAPLSRLAGIVVRLTVAVIAVFAALSLLGLAFLSDSLNEAILFIPRLVTGLVLLLVGVVLAALARVWVERTAAQLDFPIALGPLVQAAVLVIFVLCAAAQVGIALGTVILLLEFVVAALVLTFGLAFGLGSREVARALSSARYARSDFTVGQTIRMDELRGTIVRIDSAATTLRAGGETIRIPNHLLVERVVVVEEGEEAV